MITAYRVCHETSNNPGPLTSYRREYTAMREAGIEKPNPRQQILTDMAELIAEKRLEGYRPIVMMDANRHYNHPTQGDKALKDFVTATGLSDPYHERFPEQNRTYMYGSKRFDYILVDPLLVPAVKCVGYLGSHEGAYSDHVQGYVDFDTKILFQGILSRPIDFKSRKFRLEQMDRQVCQLLHPNSEGK